MPMRSLTADRICCLQPSNVRSFAPKRAPRGNWNCSSSPPDAWRSRAQVRRTSMGRQLRHSDVSCGFLHNVPNRLYRHPVSPRPSHFVESAEQPSSINGGCGEPIVQFGSHPIGNRNRSNVASLETRSTMAQCPSRCWRWSNVRATASCPFFWNLASAS